MIGAGRNGSGVGAAYAFVLAPDKTPQTITFGALTNQQFGAPPFTISATASSELPVSFASLTNSVCAVSGSTVTMIAVGTCTIQATQAGDDTYGAAPPVSQSFRVLPLSQTIAFAALPNLPLNSAPFTVSATASSGLPVSFASLTTYVCTVSGSTVTLVAVGSCTIKAMQAGNATYDGAAPVNRSFQVTLESQTIAFPALADQLFGAAPFSIGATASSGLLVSLASLTPSVCTLSGSTVTMLAIGTCTIQATQAGNATYDAAPPVNRSFQVMPWSQTIAFATLANQVFGTAPFAISATASSGLPVSFASLTPSVCTLSGSTVTMIAGGTCTIQATQAGNATYAAAAPVSQSFQVMGWSQSIAFPALANQVIGAAPFPISATASSGLPVSFASLTTYVCTVSGSTVTVAAIGTCTIRATQAGNTTYAAATPVNQSFTVAASAITGVGVSGGGVNIAPNAWVSIYGANLAPSSAASGLTWSSASSFASGQMPTSLDGVSVTVNGKPAYIYFISPTQVNVLTPLDSMIGPVAVVVNNGSTTTAAFTANLQTAAPGFLRFGDGVHIAALHADDSYLGPASMSVPGYTFTPAAPGETIMLFGDGFGLPTTALTAGSAVQQAELPTLPQITIGGAPADVQYAGLISPGLYQINVTVPTTAATGDNQVIAAYAGFASPTGAMITVAQ
jgi:uncharacterized protein (TIGR03437 family)